MKKIKTETPIKVIAIGFSVYIVIVAIAFVLVFATSCRTQKYGCKETWNMSGYNPKYKPSRP